MLWRGIWEYVGLIPRLDELRTAPKRVIAHWTGGASANSIDRKHYHFVFDRPDGHVVPGNCPVDENMEWIDDSHYAAHTRGMNSFSVGVSYAGMLNARPGGHFGAYPLLKEQVENGALFTGVALWLWGLDPLDPKHYHTHYEAESLHGIRQNNKWDITELNWGTRKKDEVGDYLRKLAADKLDALFPEPELKLATVADRKPLLLDLRSRVDR